MAHEDGLERFLAWRQVRNLTGLGRTTAWRMRQAGDFPEPVPISPGRVAWRERDIAAWNASRGTQFAPPLKAKRAPISSRTAEDRPTGRPVHCTPNAHPEPPPKAKVKKRRSISRARRGSMIAEGQLGFDF